MGRKHMLRVTDLDAGRERFIWFTCDNCTAQLRFDREVMFNLLVKQDSTLHRYYNPSWLKCPVDY